MSKKFKIINFTGLDTHEMKPVVDVLLKTMQNTGIKTGQKALEYILIDYKKRGEKILVLENKNQILNEELETLRHNQSQYNNFFNFIKAQTK